MLGKISETTGTNKEEDDMKEQNTKKMKEVERIQSSEAKTGNTSRDGGETRQKKQRDTTRRWLWGLKTL